MTQRLHHGATTLAFVQRFGVPLFAALLFCGCITPPPEFDDPAVQGDYEDGDEEHRPGQPCLLCHSDYLKVPPLPSWEVAGTVYGLIDDLEDDGLEGVEVLVTDDTGLEISVLTNRTGNFMVEVNSGSSAPQTEDPGVLEIPRPLEFPLSVKIRRGSDEQEMKTKIWRNGSCAHCHGPEPGAESVGRVYLFDEATR